MSRKLLSEITHNMQVKTYPDGTRRVLVASAPVFREHGYELADQWEKGAARERSGFPSAASVQRSKRRARQRLFDYAYSNDFRYFVTLTLDSQRVDRYDVTEVTSKLVHWLDNHVRRNGLKYVLVPERHKDGAIHFHGFFNDALSDISDSGTLTMEGWPRPKRPRSKAQRGEWLAEGAHIVYNLPSWTLGFTTAIELYGDRRSAVGYICKYVTKAQEKIGGRWYYSGGGLTLPTVELFDADYSDFLAENGGEASFSAGEIGVDFVMLEMKGGEEQ